ncbi:hypothetical protein F5146DRAFT_1144644 [Armillaria mellea]|nr:hypothetical protein F5146DRAFT_1144644 [Armillaria mellea]
MPSLTLILIGDIPASLNIGATLGAVYIGATIAAVFYGITVLQTVIYYKQNSNDPCLFRYAVALLWMLDTLHVALTTHALYFYLIESFGRYLSLFTIIWSFPLQLVINMLIVFGVQLFVSFSAFSLVIAKAQSPVPQIIRCQNLETRPSFSHDSSTVHFRHYCNFVGHRDLLNSRKSPMWSGAKERPVDQKMLKFAPHHSSDGVIDSGEIDFTVPLSITERSQFTGSMTDMTFASSIVIPWTIDDDMETTYSQQPSVGTTISHPDSLVLDCSLKQDHSQFNADATPLQLVNTDAPKSIRKSSTSSALSYPLISSAAEDNPGVRTYFDTADWLNQSGPFVTRP